MIFCVGGCVTGGFRFLLAKGLVGLTGEGCGTYCPN